MNLCAIIWIIYFSDLLFVLIGLKETYIYLINYIRVSINVPKYRHV